MNYNPAEYYIKVLATTKFHPNQNDEQLQHLCQGKFIPIPDKHMYACAIKFISIFLNLNLFC